MSLKNKPPFPYKSQWIVTINSERFYFDYESEASEFWEGKKMSLYKLHSFDNDGAPFDAFTGIIVRAKSEKSARSLAASADGRNVWLDDKASSCEIVSKYGDRELILTSYHRV